jgi:hypothetical protein
MRGAVLYAPGDVRVEDRDDPKILEPTDAIVHAEDALVVDAANLWRDQSSHVAALGDETVIAEPAHQLGPRARDPREAPPGRAGETGEPEAG